MSMVQMGRVAFVVSAFAVFFSAMRVGAADTQRAVTIISEGLRADDPVQVTFKVGMYDLLPNQPVMVDYPVWMGHALGEIKNVSNKVMIGAWFTISFPESGEGTEVVHDPMHAGTHPAGARNPLNGEDLEHGPEGMLLQSGLGNHVRGGTRVLPGETLQVPLGRDIDAWKPLLAKKRAIETYTKEQVRLDAIFFDDGTVWAPGFFGRYDPAHPHHYEQITATQFNSDVKPKRTPH